MGLRLLYLTFIKNQEIQSGEVKKLFLNTWIKQLNIIRWLVISLELSQITGKLIIFSSREPKN